MPRTAGDVQHAAKKTLFFIAGESVMFDNVSSLGWSGGSLNLGTQLRLGLEYGERYALDVGWSGAMFAGTVGSSQVHVWTQEWMPRWYRFLSPRHSGLENRGYIYLGAGPASLTYDPGPCAFFMGWGVTGGAGHVWKTHHHLSLGLEANLAYYSIDVRGATVGVTRFGIGGVAMLN